MKKGLKIAGITALVLILCFGVYLYIDHKQRENMDNYPYEPDTPAPAPHDGTFYYQENWLKFNGDGKTVTYYFNEELAELTNLPQGEHEATYVFLSGYLPPHGYIDVRYDTAMELEIRVDDDTVSMIDMAIAAEDGKSATAGVGIVSEDRIPFFFDVDDTYISKIFMKTNY